MEKYDIRNAIEAYMPSIDKLLENSNIPIFNRLFHAANIFVDEFILEYNLGSKDDFKQSKGFSEAIVPLVNDWYWNQYGKLMQAPSDKIYSGIVSIYDRPILIKIPSTTSIVEKNNETAWLTFPDCLQKSELLNNMIQIELNGIAISNNDKKKLYSTFRRIVAKTRSINLNIMTASNLPPDASKMVNGIWSHFETAISDIISSKNGQVSSAVWELNFALEKIMKVYLRDKGGEFPKTHNLIDLSKKINDYDSSIDLSLASSLPRDVIAMRYSEKSISVTDAVNNYKKSLSLAESITNKLQRKYTINNARFLIKKAPWAR